MDDFDFWRLWCRYSLGFLCLVCAVLLPLCQPLKLSAQSSSAPIAIDDTQRVQENEQLSTAEVEASSNSQASGADAQSKKFSTTKSESDQPLAETEKKPEHRGSIVVAPLPISSSAIGTGLVPILGYIFPFSKNDKTSPPSTIGATGLFTNNGSRAFGVGGQLFFKEDTYEITAGYVRGNLNYNLYGIGIAAGNAGLKLPLEQTGQVFRGEVLRRVWRRIFIGPRFFTGSSLITVRPNSGEGPPVPADVGLRTTMRSLGLRAVRDTRPNHFYPTTGSKVEFTSDFFAQALGSKYSYQSYTFQFDRFWSLSKRQVLAYDLFVCNTGGNPPFYGNCIYGASSELRGYVAGQYIDRHMFATQLEYRLSLPKKLGLAAFGGIGEVFPGNDKIFRANSLLPAIGAGPRYQLSSKYHLNLRTDFAKGKGSWTWSMGVGEAF